MAKTVGFIGTGNIAGALAGGLIGGGLAPQNIVAADPGKPQLNAFAARYGVRTAPDNCAVAAGCDVLILAVKPGIYPAVCAEIDAALRPGTLIVSVAVGTTLGTLAGYFKQPHKLLRIMPNTPAQVGAGMTAVCPGPGLTDAERDEALALFALCGRAELLPEALFDIEAAVAGSGPAFAYLFIEAMADAAVAGGMPRDKAYIFCAQTVLGAAKMVLESGEHPAQLKDRVCSPGGTTIQGVLALEAGGMRAAVQNAVQRTDQKARAMRGQ